MSPSEQLAVRPQFDTAAVSLNLSAVSVGAAVAALIGGQVIDRVNAGGIGAAASVCALLGLALAVANRGMLRRQR